VFVSAGSTFLANHYFLTGGDETGKSVNVDIKLLHNIPYGYYVKATEESGTRRIEGKLLKEKRKRSLMGKNVQNIEY
jgi:hypothetical protein